MDMTSSRPSSATIPLWANDLQGPHLEIRLPEGHSAQHGQEPPLSLLPCLIVFKGGAYKVRGGSAGFELADERGIAVVDVAYRVLKDTKTTDAGTSVPLWPRPFVDAVRAVRLVRSRAAEFGLDPARIGCVGFSAGGHLVSLLASGRELAPPPVADVVIDAFSFVPDFAVLAYPLISLCKDELQSEATLKSPAVFLGEEDPPDDLRMQLSAHLHVTSSHPPTFIWHCADDAIVPVAQARAMADRLHAAGVLSELLIVPTGGHAIGFARAGPSANDWVDRFFAWLSALPVVR